MSIFDQLIAEIQEQLDGTIRFVMEPRLIAIDRGLSAGVARAATALETAFADGRVDVLQYGELSRRFSAARFPDREILSRLILPPALDLPGEERLDLADLSGWQPSDPYTAPLPPVKRVSTGTESRD